MNADATHMARPPGWNKHPPLPAHVHPLATGGIPGWQLTLMAVTVVLLVATLVAIGYPGPGRPAAGERTRRLSDDRNRRGTDPQEQPAAAARPAPAWKEQITMSGIPRTRLRIKQFRPLRKENRHAGGQAHGTTHGGST